MSESKKEIGNQWVNFIQVYWPLLEKDVRDSYVIDMMDGKEPPAITLEDMSDIEITAMRQHQGRVIKKYRTKNDMTGEQFAELLGKKPAYLSLIESGERSLTVSDMWRIIDSLDIPATELFDFELPDPTKK